MQTGLQLVTRGDGRIQTDAGASRCPAWPGTAPHGCCRGGAARDSPCAAPRGPTRPDRGAAGTTGPARACGDPGAAIRARAAGPAIWRCRPPRTAAATAASTGRSAAQHPEAPARGRRPGRPAAPAIACGGASWRAAAVGEVRGADRVPVGIPQQQVQRQRPSCGLLCGPADRTARDDGRRAAAPADASAATGAAARPPAQLRGYGRSCAATGMRSCRGRRRRPSCGLLCGPTDRTARDAGRCRRAGRARLTRHSSGRLRRRSISR